MKMARPANEASQIVAERSARHLMLRKIAFAALLTSITNTLRINLCGACRTHFRFRLVQRHAAGLRLGSAAERLGRFADSPRNQLSSPCFEAARCPMIDVLRGTPRPHARLTSCMEGET
jgi:hypothetical protein